MTFLVDTGAQHSVLTKTKGPMSTRAAWLQGATGGKLCQWTTEWKVHLASGKVTHSFLHVPGCPYPLLGRDFLSKLGPLLETLGRLGYRGSAKKAQICQTKVTYLGYQLENGQRWLTEFCLKKSGVANTSPEKPPPNESIPRDCGVL